MGQRLLVTALLFKNLKQTKKMIDYPISQLAIPYYNYSVRFNYPKPYPVFVGNAKARRAKKQRRKQKRGW